MAKLAKKASVPRPAPPRTIIQAFVPDATAHSSSRGERPEFERCPYQKPRRVGQPPEVIRTACPSPFGTIRRASVLPQKTKVRIANGHTSRSAFPHERLQTSFRSGSFARVKLMQAADFRNLDHLTERRKLDRSVDGRIFFERQMRTASFVVFEIILQNPAQPGLMENNDVIQAFATDGAHQSFRKGILPRRSRRSQDFPNAHRFRRLTEVLTVHAVAVAQQITRGVVPGECFQKLTGCPFCCGVSGHREMNRTSAVLIENHKDE